MFSFQELREKYTISKTLGRCVFSLIKTTYLITYQSRLHKSAKELRVWMEQFKRQCIIIYYMDNGVLPETKTLGVFFIFLLVTV